MKTKFLLIPLILGLSAGPLAAEPKHHHTHDGARFKDRARVVRVEPIVERVRIPTEHRDCWTEEARSRGRHNNAGMIAGGVIGGVIGNQVGKGNERPVATVAGAVIGAAVGHASDRRRRESDDARTETHCQVSHGYVEEERISGYWVTYRYRGETFTTQMDRDPGKFVPVRVTVSLLD